MNFLEAVKELEKGKKIKRPCWQKDSYWIFGRTYDICWKDGTVAKIHLNQVKATDWEIYDEKKNLSNKACRNNDGDYQKPHYHEEDVKEHLEKFIDWYINKYINNEIVSNKDFHDKAKEIFGGELIKQPL